VVEKVFLALEGSNTDRKIAYPYVLISAATLWTGRRFKQPYFNSKVQEVFLDSGGFSFFYKSGDYEFNYKQYIWLAKRLKADYVVVMDYPCEPDVNRSKIKTNKERIERTIENAIKLMDTAPNLNWVMVVQGYKPDEYVYCIDRIKEQGLLTDIIAIGSLCVRKRVSEVKKIVTLVRDNLPSKIKLHGFGIDLKFLRDQAIFNALYSSDTAAWKWNNRNHWEENWKPKGYLPKTEFDKLKNFEKYVIKINALLSKMSSQKVLEEVDAEC